MVVNHRAAVFAAVFSLLFSVTIGTRNRPIYALAHGAAQNSANLDQSLLHPAALTAEAPESFNVRFSTTAGDVVVEVHRSWAPRGVDRFYNLVIHHYFDGDAFFRVVPGFIVQFGMSPYPRVNSAWQSATLKDDPVLHTNEEGTITFATAGPNTRTTQFFINFGNNSSLDSQGFAPFGRVIEGMDVVKQIYSGYGERPDQREIMSKGETYLEAQFPSLDTIKFAVVLLPGSTRTPGQKTAIPNTWETLLGPAVENVYPPEPKSTGNTRGVSAVPDSKADLSRAQIGRFVALVIGIQNYRFLPKLRTPKKDAEYVAATLHDRYGFETRILEDANRSEITKALSEYRRSLDQNANLLVYYAGHGYYDKDADKAYWLPADAQLDDPSNWIIADEITAAIRVLPARHILIISDSCYSVGINRDINPSFEFHSSFTPDEWNRYLRKMIDGKSRTLMSSGGLEPVSDSGSGGHSVFANALLKGLATIDAQAFSAGILFQNYVGVSVTGESDQQPQYEIIRNSGHDSGDFVFIRVSQ